MATCCKHCMAVLEIPFCQFFTDFLKEPAITKHEFSKITLRLQVFGSVFRYKSHLFMYPKIFIFDLQIRTPHSQKWNWFELNPPMLVHIQVGQFHKIHTSIEISLQIEGREIKCLGIYSVPGNTA